VPLLCAKVLSSVGALENGAGSAVGSTLGDGPIDLVVSPCVLMTGGGGKTSSAGFSCASVHKRAGISLESSLGSLRMSTVVVGVLAEMMSSSQSKLVKSWTSDAATGWMPGSWM